MKTSSKMCAASLVLATSLSLAVFAGGAPRRVSPSRAQQTRKPSSAANLPLIDVDGYKRALSKYHGKPLMVSFWATWCEPCQAEFPEIVQLAQKYQPQGLAVFGVSLDNDADMHLVRHFLADTRPGFPNYRQKPGIDVDAFYRGVNPHWTGTMPETIFYGRDGRIVGDLTGGQPSETLERAIRYVLAPASAAHSTTH